MASRSRFDFRSIRSKTIDELEGFTPKPAVESGLVEAVLRARAYPIESLTPGQIRLLISQRHGTQYLFPLALELLEANPWLEAEYYPGDLLRQLATLDPAFWPPGEDWRQRLGAVMERALTTLPELSSHDRDQAVESSVREALVRFGHPAA